MGGKESGGPVTIGYHYFLSMHLAICHGPVDYLKDIRTGENTIIFGATGDEANYLRPTNGDLNTPTAVRISKPNIFGGKKKEGGVGTDTCANSMIYILWGGEEQPQLERLKELITEQELPTQSITYFETNNVPVKTTTITGNTLLDKINLKIWKDSLVGSNTSAISVKTTNVASETILEDLGDGVLAELIRNTLTTSGIVTTAASQGIPAFRRITSVIWDDLHYQTNTSRPKPWNFKVCRIPLRGTRVDNTDVSVISQKVANPNNFITGVNDGDLTISKKGSDLWINTAKVTKPKMVNGDLVSFILDGYVCSTGNYIAAGNGNTKANAPTTNTYTSNLNQWWYLGTAYSVQAVADSSAWYNIGWNSEVSGIVSNYLDYPDGIIYSASAGANLGDVDSTVILEEANPALILAEVLVDPTWGLGYLPEMLDIPSFEAAAKTLFDEGFGVSALWENESTVEDFLSMILNTINGMLYVSPKTGQFVLRLIRKEDAKIIADENNLLEMRSYSRMATSELTNQVTIQWTDPILGSVKSATVHNPAVFEMQGFTVSTTRQYPIVTSQDVALAIAARDLGILSQPLAQVELVGNRQFSSISIGDVIEWHWNDLGVEEMSLRVMSIGYGLLDDGRITLKCTEDIFGVDTSAFTVMQGTQFKNSKHLEPEAPLDFEIVNLNYVDLFRLKANRGITTQFDVVDESNGAIAVFAAASQDQFKQFDFYARFTLSGETALGSSDGLPDSEINSKYYQSRGVFDFIPYATTANVISRTATTIPLATSLWLSKVPLNSYLYCGGEWMQVVSFAADYSSVTVNRGIISSVPKIYAAGVFLWFYSEFLDKVTVDVEWVAGQEVTGTPLTWNNEKLLSTTVASQSKKVVVNTNWVNPYPVANLQATLSEPGVVAVSWNSRDKEFQQDKLVGQTEGNIVTTQGIYYAIRVYSVAGVLLIELPSFFEQTFRYATTQPVTIAVATVQKDRHSEWNWVTFNPNSNLTIEVAPPSFGTFLPVMPTLSENIEVSILGDFTYDELAGELLFKGDTLKFSLKTNYEDILAATGYLYDEIELSDWFETYVIEVYSLENVDAQGNYILLNTRYTKESTYEYRLYENALDHTVPSPTLLFKIYVEDKKGIRSDMVSKFVSSDGVIHAITNTRFRSTTGLSVPSDAPREGACAIFGTVDPNTLIPKFETISTPYVYFKEGLTDGVSTYPVYEPNVDKTAWVLSPLVIDMTNFEVLVPFQFGAIEEMTLFKFNTTNKTFEAVI